MKASWQEHVLGAASGSITNGDVMGGCLQGGGWTGKKEADMGWEQPGLPSAVPTISLSTCAWAEGSSFTNWGPERSSSLGLWCKGPVARR